MTQEDYARLNRDARFRALPLAEKQRIVRGMTPGRPPPAGRPAVPTSHPEAGWDPYLEYEDVGPRPPDVSGWDPTPRPSAPPFRFYWAPPVPSVTDVQSMPAQRIEWSEANPTNWERFEEPATLQDLENLQYRRKLFDLYRQRMLQGWEPGPSG
jgi:hypothetical protein